MLRLRNLALASTGNLARSLRLAARGGVLGHPNSTHYSDSLRPGPAWSGARHRPTRHSERGSEQRGQATVELVAAVPALLLAGALALQLLATGYALTLADGAAEAGALALATGRPVVQAARQALPSWAEDDVDVKVGGGRVTVRLRPPSLLHSVADLLAVTSSAAARPKK